MNQRRKTFNFFQFHDLGGGAFLKEILNDLSNEKWGGKGNRNGRYRAHGGIILTHSPIDGVIS